MKSFSKLFIASLVLLGWMTSGVTLLAQPTFALKAGANLNSVSQNFADEKLEYDTKMQIGYHIGVLSDIPLNDAISIQPGLNFTTKGSNYGISEWADGEVTGYDRMRLNYLELPVNVAFNLGENVKLFVGPYVAMGLNGVNKWDVTYTENGTEINETGETDIVFKSGEVDPADLGESEIALRQMDVGANAGLMLYMGPAFLSVSYLYGFGNLTPAVLNGPDAKDFQKRLQAIYFALGFNLN